MTKKEATSITERYVPMCYLLGKALKMKTDNFTFRLLKDMVSISPNYLDIHSFAGRVVSAHPRREPIEVRSLHSSSRAVVDPDLSPHILNWHYSL